MNMCFLKLVPLERVYDAVLSLSLSSVEEGQGPVLTTSPRLEHAQTVPSLRPGSLRMAHSVWCSPGIFPQVTYPSLLPPSTTSSSVEYSFYYII